jgi:hypothetical protein
MKPVGIILAALLLTCAVAGSGFAQSTVVMNEIYSRGVAGNLDWIEVYNPTGASIDIAGYKIYDIGGQGGTKAKKPFPSGTILPAHGFYVIVTDTNSTGLTDGFGLSSSGEKVWLENATGTIIDSVAFPFMGNDTSYARQSDGAATWGLLFPLTRGTTNSQVTMNEIYSRGVAGNLDWIEVYNTTGTSIDITGYKIYDIGGQGGTKTKKPFPSGTIVPAHGFYVIVTDTNSTGLTDGFGLSSSGEKVWLENATGTIIDSVAFPFMGNDTSYARQPDGSPTWALLSPLTRGTKNSTSTGVDEEIAVATGYGLMQNYPNPFNPTTTIGYIIAGTGNEATGNRWVKLAVYDLLGREVAVLVNENQQVGHYTVQFSADKLGSGIYFYTLSAGNFFETKRMMVLK